MKFRSKIKVIMFILILIYTTVFTASLNDGKIKLYIGDNAFGATNLFDESKVKAGYVWNAGFYETTQFNTVNISTDSVQLNITCTGAISSAASDYIPVNSGVAYNMQFTQQIVSGNCTATRSIYIFYNSNKERISGETNTWTTSVNGIVAPAGASYIRWFFAPTSGSETGSVKYFGINFCKVNEPPSIALNSPNQDESFSTTLSLRGVVNDTNTSDVLTIKYKIDNDLEQILQGSIVSDGTNKEFMKTLDVKVLSEGGHTVTIWCTDQKGDSSAVIKLNFIKINTTKLYITTVAALNVKLNISDADSLNTQYQITCNSQYVTEDGSLTKTPTWIRRENTQVTSSSITVTGLQEKTKYTFGIKAKHADDLGGVTFNSVECTTTSNPPAMPENLNAKPYTDKVTFSWNSVSNATQYEIEADGKISTTSALSFTHSGLQPNSRHTYRARAKAGSTVGEWSPYVTVYIKSSLPEVPKSIISESQGTSIIISWTSVANATSYELNIDGNIFKTGLKTSYTHTGLKPNTQHTVKVRAIGIEGAGGWSPYYTVNTTDGVITSSPNKVTAVSTNKTVTLSWDAVDDAEGYDISIVSNDGTSGSAIDNGNLTTCEFRELQPGSSYKYMVRAKNSAGVGPWSNVIQVDTFLLDTPENITFEKNDTSIKLSWDYVSGADSYELKYYPAQQDNRVTGNSIVIESNAVPGITLNGLNPCAEYKYSIRAKNSQGYSCWRDEMSVFTLPKKPEIPTNVNASVTESKIMISWTGLQDTSVVGYDVELDGVLLENNLDVTYIHEGLDPYSVHTYRVRARNDLVEGDWSPKYKIRTLPAKPVAPKDITVKSTQTGATLTWMPELGAKCYDIYVFKLDDKGNEVKIEEINNIEECTYTHRRQVKGEEYRYRIRTRNVQGISQWSGDIINNAIKAECKKNNTIDLGLTATDVVDFSSYEMVVTFNPGVVEVVDLSTITGKADLGTGKIDGTGVTVKEFSNGRIVFVVEKAITPGEAWTGVINGIKFKAKVTGGTTITYTVYEKE